MNTNQFKFLFIIALQFFYLSIYPQEYKIFLDENYSDWDNITGISDSNDSAIDIDLQSLKVTNYKEYLFLLLELNKEINLQDFNSITLYIDFDNNSSTGFSTNGIGAELEYSFGEREGVFYYDNSSTNINHSNIGLISSPTVTSNKFEIQIKLNSIISGNNLLADSTLHIVIKDKTTNGDVIPNEDGGLEYRLTENISQYQKMYSMRKPDENNLRILSYNVERDKLFETYNKESYRRIFNAIKPDLFGFQEIANHSALETANLIEELLPSGVGQEWFYKKQGHDIIVISRFPIISSYTLDGNGAFLLDLNAKYNGELLFVNAHPPCCDNNESRQHEIDNFMSFIRDAKEEGGILSLEDETPIIVVGDMNLVGNQQQQATLITGEIVNVNSYGEAFMPDWDSTYFADSKPYTTNMPNTFTWYNSNSQFSPGRLDYIVYSNSVINATNSFVLFTDNLPEDSLVTHGLLRYDVTSVSDHLPVVADFEFKQAVSVKENNVSITEFSLSQNYPNPFNPNTVIKYSIPKIEKLRASFVQLRVYDILGRKVVTLINEKQKAGKYHLTFDANNLSSGIYFYQLKVESFIETKKMILLQ
ncbi:MAG: T9SS type A sorting domain-containing protein [Ignavibacteriae bacterium]|nr:T9SS type A sorting domain-containing protein [Ignavibacteriota bacterium]